MTDLPGMHTGQITSRAIKGAKANVHRAPIPPAHLLPDRLIGERPDRAALMAAGLIASVFADTEPL